MPAFPRAELEEMMRRWIAANDEAGRTGDWGPLAEFYAEDALYSWNNGPKYEFVARGRKEIAEFVFGTEMSGLEKWSYPYVKVLIDDADIYGPGVDVVALRRRVGMVFQKSNPFPKSIFDNIAYGLRINGMAGSRSELTARVEESLRQAALWDEVKDRLYDSALAMSGGQQQRLCIARALAVRPDILLMDEPASALDPISTTRIEDLIHELKRDYTIAIVTHNMQQAARVADMTAFFSVEVREDGKGRNGVLVEYDLTTKIFTNPSDQRTEDYVTGRFG